MKPRVLGMILAGGQGSRLSPLTLAPLQARRAVRQQVPHHRLRHQQFHQLGLFSIYVLTQYKAQSLTEHIQRGWRFGTFLSDYFITLVPAQMYRFEELGPVWYRGTADAVYQNLHLVDNHDADYVAIFSGDHIYKMNVEHMLQQHIDSRADISIAAYPMPQAQAHQFGIMHVDEKWKVTDFLEKPKDPPSIPGQPGTSLTSMGNYIFSRRALEELLETNMSGGEEGFDFGKDVIPRALSDGYNVHGLRFSQEPDSRPGPPQPVLARCGHARRLLTRPTWTW